MDTFIGLLTHANVWFLIFLIFVLVLIVGALGKYFIYSMSKLFDSLNATIGELKNMIKELFEDRNNHSERLSRLEARCEERHGQRTGLERRKTHMTE